MFRKTEMPVTRGSGNVFADLKLPAVIGSGST